MHIVQWVKTKDRLPEETGKYLCCYVIKEIPDFLYQVFEFNANAKEFQFGYVGVVVTHWMEIPKLEKLDAAISMVEAKEEAYGQ